LALAKALKLSKKFSSRSSSLSLIEKASAAKVGIQGGKKSLPCTGVSVARMTQKVLDLFRSASSAFEDETAEHAPYQKRPQKSPSKTSQKYFDVPPVKGTSIQRRSIHFVLCSLYLTFVLAAADFQLVGISTNASAKESGHEEVHAAKSPSS
jgi:hypothetical protein